MTQPQRGGKRQPASWEKYVKKYVWDEDSTPYLIPVKRLKKYQADKEIFLFCAFMVMPAALLVAAFVSALAAGQFNNLALGTYGVAILLCAYFLKQRKSVSAAIFAFSAPVLLLLHFAINGFSIPNLNINKVELSAVDMESDRLTLAKKKRWRTGYGMALESTEALPRPLEPNAIYYLIRGDDEALQLAWSRAEAHEGKAINLTSPGTGELIMRRIVQLHFIEKAGMIVITLLWLRYTFRVLAIARAYPSLSSIRKDDNPWSKFTGPPPG